MSALKAQSSSKKSDTHNLEKQKRTRQKQHAKKKKEKKINKIIE